MPRTERKHAVTIPAYKGDLDELAVEIGRLRYDALARFLEKLALELARQSDGDQQRGRRQLAQKLIKLSASTHALSLETWKTWTLCKPHTAAELEETPQLNRHDP